MSLKPTIERIKALEAEKTSLLAEIESLKKLVEQKAAALEREVGVLREEAKSLKTLVSVPEVGQK
jgi:hypothetical protein